MEKPRKIMKILQTFLRKYKNIRKHKSLAKQKVSNKLEYKNLKKI